MLVCLSDPLLPALSGTVRAMHLALETRPREDDQVYRKCFLEVSLVCVLVLYDMYVFWMLCIFSHLYFVCLSLSGFGQRVEYSDSEKNEMEYRLSLIHI